MLRKLALYVWEDDHDACMVFHYNYGSVWQLAITDTILASIPTELLGGGGFNNGCIPASGYNLLCL